MTDTFERLKNELRVLQPDFTEAQLTETTSTLIDFSKIVLKIVLEDKENFRNDTEDFILSEITLAEKKDS